MRIRNAVNIGLLLTIVGCPVVHAGPEIYLSGGLALNNLRNDAELFGEAIAVQLETGVGGSWASDKTMRTGFDMGLGVRHAGSGVVGGAIELRYVTRGCRYEFDELTGSGLSATGTWKFDYVEIPVLLQVTPPASGSVRPVLLIGPVLGIKASADFEVEAGGQSQSLPVGNVIKSTTFGGLVGAGVMIAASPRSSVDLQARYQLGFTNLMDSSAAGVSFKATGFSLLAGWSWALGGTE